MWLSSVTASSINVVQGRRLYLRNKPLISIDWFITLQKMSSSEALRCLLDLCHRRSNPDCWWVNWAVFLWDGFKPPNKNYFLIKKQNNSKKKKPPGFIGQFRSTWCVCVCVWTFSYKLHNKDQTEYFGQVRTFFAFAFIQIFLSHKNNTFYFSY